MKKYMLQVLLLIVMLIATSCSTDNDPKPQPTFCITTLLGDKDGFGFGLTEGEAFSLEGVTMLPIDFRSQSDPPYTDIYPADMGTSSTPARQISFEIEYDPFPGGVSSASLTMFALGIQDGDTQVVGSDEDYQLFINDQEVPEAFDEVDQFDYVNEQWSEIASTIEIELPEELLHELQGGRITIRIEINQQGSSQSSDAFALDYAELTVCPKDEAGD